MNGETNLDILLSQMQPVLDQTTYVFATSAGNRTELRPLMTFQEDQEYTLILSQACADAAGLDYVFACKRITLTVHSSLEAVGFIARVASHLAAAGMGVNPVSGYYHDHLFVPAQRADEAMDLLRALAAQP